MPLFLTEEALLTHHLSAAVAIFLATLEIQKGFYEIEFYNSIQGWVYSLPVVEVLGKMPVEGGHM